MEDNIEEGIGKSRTAALHRTRMVARAALAPGPHRCPLEREGGGGRLGSVPSQVISRAGAIKTERCCVYAGRPALALTLPPPPPTAARGCAAARLHTERKSRGLHFLAVLTGRGVEGRSNRARALKKSSILHRRQPSVRGLDNDLTILTRCLVETLSD